jgi:serine/threonine-protein kinase HipA
MDYREIYVSISLDGKDHFIGRLWCCIRKGEEKVSFTYSNPWLKSSESTLVNIVSKEDILTALEELNPVPWERMLMQQEENRRAKELKRQPLVLWEVDYLLGVNDEVRQGALRLSESLNGPYLARREEQTIPSFADLLSFSEDLKMLLSPDRPKLFIKDEDGELAIAKFLRGDDEVNFIVWEAVALTLAKKAGINTCKWRLETVKEKPVLIIKRFDRRQEKRIPFLSAMSMLGAKSCKECSYLEIIHAIFKNGGNPTEDVEELWRRIIFNILIANTDDHLKNHAFLYETSVGWRLSPAYDLNPVPLEIKSRELTTSIDLQGTKSSLETAFSIISECKIPKKRAEEIVKEVKASVCCWKKIAKSFGLEKKEIDFMSSAFEV